MTTAHPHKNPAVADIDAREAADPRVALTNGQCQREGGWGPTTQRKKQAEGYLNIYRDGTRVMKSPGRVLRARLRASRERPATEGASAKKRCSSRAGRAPLTEAERAGLRAGNEGRHEAAQQRREARTAARTWSLETNRFMRARAEEEAAALEGRGPLKSKDKTATPTKGFRSCAVNLIVPPAKTIRPRQRPWPSIWLRRASAPGR